MELSSWMIAGMKVREESPGSIQTRCRITSGGLVDKEPNKGKCHRNYTAVCKSSKGEMGR